MKDLKIIPIYLALTGATSINTAPELGEITVANAGSQGFAASLAQDVSGYLAGLTDPDEEANLNALIPLVQTADFFQYPVSADEAFLTEADDSDIRAIGAGFKRIEFHGTTATDATAQKGLTIRVDHRTLPRVNGTIVPGWENRNAASLMRRLTRADYLRGLSVIDGAGYNTGITFSATTNPDGLLRAAVERTRVKSGRVPTHLVLGASAQQLRQDAYEDYSRANHAMAAHADYTMQQLANYLGVGQVIVCKAIKQVAKDGAKANVLASLAYSYSAESGTMVGDPSNVKRAWSPTMSGGRWAVFIQEGAAWTDITVFHQTKIFAPLTAGVEKLTIS